jgi:hypothetical protein
MASASAMRNEVPKLGVWPHMNIIAYVLQCIYDVHVKVGEKTVQKRP